MKYLVLIALLVVSSVAYPTSDQDGSRRIPTKEDIIDSMKRAHEEAYRSHRSGLAKNMDNVERLYGQSAVDINALFAQYDKTTANVILGQRDMLLVFVSLSMPREALLKVGKDTSRAGGKIVFRGFHKNKLSEMQKAVMFMNEAGVTDIMIDPISFRRYNIVHVPTYVVARIEESVEMLPSCEKTGKCSDDHYVAISGDVTLDYALDKMLYMAPSSFSSSIKEYMRRLGRQ